MPRIYTKTGDDRTTGRLYGGRISKADPAAEAHGSGDLTGAMVERLETWIDELVLAHPLPTTFVVPGANPISASLDTARSVARRAERRAVELRETRAEVNEEVLRYLNRLSDLLFVLARVEAGEAEPASREP